MSEEILKAIIHLLVIVAKEDEVTLDEKASILNFLMENFAKDDANRYYRLFEELIVKEDALKDQEKQIEDICQQINNSQTSQQKIVVILKLVELIAADGTVSNRETELLYLISKKLNINSKIADLIKAFVIYQERNKIISGNILIVDDGQTNISDKCKQLMVQGMEGFLFILRIPEIEVYFAKYVGEQSLFINGSPMRTNQVYVFPLGSVIKSELHEPVFYTDVVSKFRGAENAISLSFVADHVHFKFKNGNIGLRNINIHEEGGKLIALMGGSGAGKSTLLNVLNGNEQPSEGVVKINGVDIHNQKKNVEGVIGYIPQDDLLIEELTVYENMYFSAKLCFKDKTDEELDDLVNETIDSLGLAAAKNLKVGSPLDKSISGGQRKRLNIGLELLREPSVMFVDEPTSGLSSRDSENIMELLKELSLKGKMVFVVIHQPSEDIFKMFDKLILLDVGGYQIYYGNPVEGISYFKRIVNMIDSKTNANPEQIFNIIESKLVNEYGQLTKQRKTSPEQWSEEFEKRHKAEPIEESTDIPPQTLKIPNKIKQFAIFSHRDLKSKLSNKQYLLVNLLEAPVLAIILALIIKYIPEDTTEYVFKKNQNIPVFFFMSVIVSLFMGLTVSAEEIIRDRRILKREAFLNLSRMSYLGSKVIIMLFISAIQTLTFVVIGSMILEIQGMTMSQWIILFSISSFANMLGLNVSSAFKSAVTVYVLIPLLIIPQLLLSGVVVNFDKLNPKITAEDKVPLIGEVMASRWAYEALAVTQFKTNDYQRDLYPFEKQIAQAEFKTVYLLPRLESEIEHARIYLNNGDEESRNLAAYNLKTLSNELNKILAIIGQDKFAEVDKLNVNDFDNELADKTKEFIQKLKAYYNLKSKKAHTQKEAVMNAMMEEYGSNKVIAKMRGAHENDAITVVVKNTTTEHRILENDNELIQKIYPIFLDHEFPDHPLDFRAQFYAPTKHIFGMNVDTLVFNVIMIWCMSIFLIIALYFDWLRKLIGGDHNH
ncbi:MAG: ATP-binding cassette domain-containing protein [Cyclobacteriaceae bacterium]